METLLLINSSARSARSVTRQLTARFAATWASHHPEGAIISRDVGLNPPSFINETWISDAFAEPNGQPSSLATSEALIDELFRASAVVIGAPMYNFGMPAQLKAYVDQVVRVGRTFAFASGNAEWPYQPLIPAKPLTIITSAGAAGYEPGGPLELSRTASRSRVQIHRLQRNHVRSHRLGGASGRAVPAVDGRCGAVD